MEASMVYECSTPVACEEGKGEERVTNLKSHDSARSGEFVWWDTVAVNGMSGREKGERNRREVGGDLHRR
jgi:hypothetical protein